ncbi:ABC transporter ATP-binding protein [Gemmatimonadota bacterium]
MPVTEEGTTIVLSLDGITRSFGDLRAVDNLSLEVHRGEIFGFLGPNGAGKTTTISMVCGLLAPDLGIITINGQPVDARSRDLRRRLGFCPQEIVIWENLTCREQLEFTGHLYDLTPVKARDRTDELLDVLGLTGQGDRLARTLSGGMKRRLNIALALIHEPEILILDEPQAGLDPQSRVLVREYVRSLAGRLTVILTTHDMEEADRLADRVAVIDQGRLLVLDTPEQLKDTIGEGDLLEIELPGADEDQLDTLCRGLSSSFPDLMHQAEWLRLVGHDVYQVLPSLLEQIRGAGLSTGEVRIRRRTLEDVFIALTGRGLRE